VFIASINAQDEGVKLSSLSLSGGKGALTSGLFFEANFANGNDAFNLSLGEKDLYFFYLKGLFNGKFSIGPCLEYYYNTPVVGVMGSINPSKYISALSWAGWSAGEPGGKITPLKWKFLFFYQGLDFTFKRVAIGGAIMYGNHC
jgi:hypothetical protein